MSTASKRQWRAKNPERSRRAEARRAALRLKHTLALDDELNEVIPDVAKAYWRTVMLGNTPAPVDVKKLLEHEQKPDSPAPRKRTA